MNNEIPDFFKERDVLGLEKQIIHYTEFDSIKEHEKPRFVYATLGSRILAYIFDLLILEIPIRLIGGIFSEIFTVSLFSWKVSFFNLIVWTLYYGIMESSENQATIGKTICGIKVTDENGDRLNFKQASLRFLAQLISFIPLGFGIWAIAFSEKNQAWHDSLTECLVIKKSGNDHENDDILDSESV